MKTSLKKIAAVSTLVAMMAINAAYAATGQIGTGTVTGGSTSPIIISNTTTFSGAVATGSLNVQVSAVVVPTLSMTISTGAINFGTLTPNIASTGTLTITTTTNANAGITVSMASANGLYDSAIGKHIGVNGNGSTTTDATDYYKVRSAVTAGGTALTLQDVTTGGTTQNILVGSNVTQSNDTATVDLVALAGNQTEAGNYSDTLTFTVVGNF